MSYQQLLAGGLTFQLYNKQTNSIIPSSISDGGGYLEIVEDADDSHDTIYKIDQFAGSKTEITLYTEGQSAATYALMAVSQNEGIHSIRTFAITREYGPDSLNYVYVEVDGKMYLPYILDDGIYVPVADVDGHFEPMADNSYIVGNSVFPYIQVELEDDPNLGEGAIMKVPSIDNVTTEARHCIEVFYKEEYQNDYPWRYGQDGFFYLSYGWAIRVNGIWHAIVMGGQSVDIDNSDHIDLYNHSGGIYTAQNPELVMDAAGNTTIQNFKENAEEDFGITFGDDIEVAEAVDGDDPQPFALYSPV